MIEEPVEKSKVELDVPRDQNEWSIALRMAYFVTLLIKTTNLYEHLDFSEMSSIYVTLSLTAQLANDKVGLMTANDLWLTTSPELDTDLAEFVADAQGILAKLTRDLAIRQGKLEVELDPRPISAVMENLEQNCLGHSSEAFYNARAMAYLNQKLFEACGQSAPGVAGLGEVLKRFRKLPGMACVESVWVSNPDLNKTQKYSVRFHFWQVTRSRNQPSQLRTGLVTR